MMLMMLAQGASIISIIGVRFSNLKSSGTLSGLDNLLARLGRVSGLVFKNLRAHDVFLGVFWGPQKAFKNPAVARAKVHVSFGLVLIEVA